VSARKILICDDNDEFRTEVIKTLGGAFVVSEADSISAFWRTFKPCTFDLIILDMRLEKGREGLELLRKIRSYDELQPVIMVSAYGDTDAVLDAAEAGALMFLHKKDFSPDLLARMVEAVLQQAALRRQLLVAQNRTFLDEVLGLSSRNHLLKQALKLAQRAADREHAFVLVAGEYGTGSEMIAQVIHTRSRRRCEAPFVAVSDFSGGEVERVLLGSTGQLDAPRRRGSLEQANGGVLYLESPQGFPETARSRLAQVIQERKILLHPEGVSVPLDFQLVVGSLPENATANRGWLESAAQGGEIVEIYLPALRDRKEDIPLLATYYLQEYRRRCGGAARTLAQDALTLLETYSWPGNLYELKTVIEGAAVQAVAMGDAEIKAQYLPLNFSGPRDGERPLLDFRTCLAQAELGLVNEALKRNANLNKTELAGLLGYTDRFAFSRRVRKAMVDFPALGNAYPDVKRLFGMRG
jgi:DNA-binding NtrC family response regulator